MGEWMEANVTAEQVAASALYLLHRECPVSGQFFSTGGGRMSRVVLASPRGYFNPDITPEEVRDHWSEVCGQQTPDGEVNHVYELNSSASEFELIQGCITRWRQMEK